MLGWRLAISAILIPSIVLLFFLDAHLGTPAPVLFLLCVFLCLRSTYEMIDLMRERSFAPHWRLTALCGVAVIVAAWGPRMVGLERNTLIVLGVVAMTYAMCVLLLFFAAAMRYREPGRSVDTLGAEILTVSYAGFLLGLTAQLRWVVGTDAGYIVLGSLLVTAKSGDVGAFFVGRLFGRRKMAPLLSPGKTWAGAVGALLGGAVGAWAWLTYATPWLYPEAEPTPWYWSALYGVLIGIVGLIGDLCESMVKRDMGKKDSANLLPGFGGLLDLLDSVLYSGPVALVLWVVLPLATWR
ncbi:Phosphatidate cytidylyltransferase [Maioricimonas rarisocia]|uniref:Phosphatidate cytidylyltransferase n=1 Tax=Maioricimonas rarisocia TaxID=2528026 RepID=A0A517Z8U8_9PLAN|nr:phosphatidate cytidylyltransferase [Maioricimonas rarisocia]QDU38908.1 Phosphatidate cytidylyltransferase [Maioricimonas rarisocia]